MGIWIILGFLAVFPQSGVAEVLISPPSPTIEFIQIEPDDLRDDILPLLPFQVGGNFNPKFVEIAKKLLEGTEKFESVQIQWNPKLSRIEIQAKERKYFKSIVWTGDKVSKSQELERQCLNRHESVDLSQERLSKISRCFMEHIQGRGFLEVQVLIEPEGEKFGIHIQLGPLYRVGKVEFFGNRFLDSKTLHGTLQNRVGKVFAPLELDKDERAILKKYQSKGFYLAEIYKPSFDIRTDSKTVSITFRIREFHPFQIKFIGDYNDKAPLNSLLEREEPFPKWFVDEMADLIQDELNREGYLLAEVQAERKFLETGTEQILIRTIEGKRFTLTEPEWIGLSDQKGVQKFYSSLGALRVGKPFDEDEFKRVLNEDFYNLLLTEGYLDIQIRSLDFVIDEQNGFIKPVIYMSEGERYTIEEIFWEGFEKNALEFQEAEDFRKSMKVGGYFDVARVDRLQKEFARILIEEGHLDAVIHRDVKKKDGKLFITIRGELGPLYRVGKILIRGLKYTDYDVMKREIILRVGDVYREEAVRDAVAQIFRLGLARNVDFTILEKDPETGLVYVLVDVIEAGRFRFEFGPGYGTLDGLRGIFRGTYANIGGTGRRLTVFAKANRKVEESALPDPAFVLDPHQVPFIERRISLEYFEPSLFGWPVDGRMIISHAKDDLGRFDIFKNSFTWAIDYRLTRRWIFTTHYDIEFSDPFNIAVDQTDVRVGQLRLHGLGETLNVNYLDDSFDPVKGFKSQATADIFDQRLGGDSNFWQTTGKQDFFYPLWTFAKKKNIGTAFSLNLGFSDAFGNTHEIPVEKRFYVGGENSVRGFGEDAITPINQNGGNSYFYFQSELYFPLFFGLDLLAFFDGGNAYNTNFDFKPWDLKYAAGPGIRWNTPFGPFKVGYGFILDRQRINGKLEPLGHFYLGVGPI